MLENWLKARINKSCQTKLVDRHILETPVTEREFLEQLHELNHKINFVKEQSFQDARSCLDVRDTLEKLKIKVTPFTCWYHWHRQFMIIIIVVWDEHFRNDLFYIEWDVKPYSVSQSLSVDPVNLHALTCRNDVIMFNWATVYSACRIFVCFCALHLQAVVDYALM